MGWGRSMAGLLCANFDRASNLAAARLEIHPSGRNAPIISFFVASHSRAVPQLPLNR